MPQAGFELWAIHINTCVNIVPSTLPLDHHGRICPHVKIGNKLRLYNLSAERSGVYIVVICLCISNFFPQKPQLDKLQIFSSHLILMVE